MEFYSSFKGCGKKAGFFPGTDGGMPYPTGLSDFLLELNQNPTKEGKYAFSILSIYDETVVPYIYDRYTSEFSTQDACYKLLSPEYNHIAVKDLTVDIQYDLVTAHKHPTQGKIHVIEEI